MNAERRIAGLDLLRAGAIIAVVIAHYPKPVLGSFTRALNFGWAGVDLFFVLSGFLIGGQLFKHIASDTRISLRTFYLKRLMRTLPAYYAVLCVYYFLSPPPGWKYLVFVQNFGSLGTFAPSWSLCVEEQFYIAFPAIILLMRFLRLPMLAITGVALFCPLLRAWTWIHVRPDLLAEPGALNSYMQHLYYPTFVRLDGISLGIGLAAIKFFKPGIWQAIMRSGNRLIVISLTLLVLSVTALWSRYSLSCAAFGFTLLSLSFSSLTAAALSNSCILSRFRVPGAQLIAAISYSIYLTHTLALEIVKTRFPTIHAGSALILTLSLILLFAGVVHLSVERPAMVLRANLLASFKQREGAGTLVDDRELVES